MPSLKELRNRIGSVRQTQKITSAMKLVAASKLRRAQERAESSRPYAARMAAMLANLGSVFGNRPDASPLLAGTGKSDVHLLVVATADRGLCGGFNGTIVRGVRRRIAELRAEGKEVKLFSIGRKGRDQLRREFGSLMIDHVDGIGRPQVEYSEALSVADRLRALYDEGAFDVCTVVFNTFRSAMRQDLTFRQLIPVENPESSKDDDGGGVKAAYEFEPEEDEILAELLPRNLAVQVYGALVENAASEQGARMVAMDNATRNAGDMIKSLSLRYNRTRQAMITKELIEIVSGAEAL